MYYAPNVLEEAGKAWRHDTRANRAMSRVLLPIDGSDGALRAVAHLTDTLEGCERPEIHLLNVQAPIMSGDVGLNATAAMVRAFRLAAGGEALSRARGVLNRKGIAHKSAILFGKPADVIAHYAKDHGIDRIVMGTRGLGVLKSLLLGSVAARVVGATHVPVTLVK